MSSRPSADRTDSSPSALNSSTDSSAELQQVVDDLLTQLQSKFTNVSSELLAKMEDMSRRLDNLEATIQTGDGKASGASK
ncbi:hypothetical protein DPSP01_013670 [Paraphaeosphaeria sporulosa]|uniref:Heat shock factor binding protein 1 n=1 Tax=Paraphaeosphaeria sporulosa TaxID=1460663 RepID=A0A177C5H6_9PLEO|nr:uncharacterized protein CC84DRAFT_1166574 [Paraphaeosphaeria sporulosa]OAG02765.1 hypothetical protein CC84DRAFT_1166574 [Paraphaeosphaeria sporulosa]